MVIVLPTNSENCSTQAQCVFRVRFLQTFDIESQQRDDISFNFLIGGDGNVYIGRGWDQVGAHMPGYNKRSLSFAFIGTFQHQEPSAKQMNVTKLLLEEGVNLGKIDKDYKLYGAGTLQPTITEYNAEKLYKSFSKFAHWATDWAKERERAREEIVQHNHKPTSHDEFYTSIYISTYITIYLIASVKEYVAYFGKLDLSIVCEIVQNCDTYLIKK